MMNQARLAPNPRVLPTIMKLSLTLSLKKTQIRINFPILTTNTTVYYLSVSMHLSIKCGQKVKRQTVPGMA
jgi:hypothetical protein